MVITLTATGNVFISAENAKNNDEPPLFSNKVDDDNIFSRFVKDFWLKITTQGDDSPDSLITAYAIYCFVDKGQDFPEITSAPNTK